MNANFVGKIKKRSDVNYDFVYVDQESFEKFKPVSFKQLVDGFREYKEKI